MSTFQRAPEPLDKDTVARFHRDGFVVVPACVASERIETLRRAFDELLAIWSAECGVTRARYLEVVSQWTNVWERHPAFAAQLRHPKVIAIRDLNIRSYFQFSLVSDDEVLNEIKKLTPRKAALRTYNIRSPWLHRIPVFW